MVNYIYIKNLAVTIVVRIPHPQSADSYHITSLSHDSCIKNKDDHLDSISYIEDGVASKVSM